MDAPIVSSGDVALISGGSSSYRSYVCSGVDSFGIPICSFKTFVEDAHVTASGKITVGGVLTVNAPGASTVSGVISGSGCLKMQGTGTLVLSKSNVYTGGTTVSAGTLVCAAPGCLGSSGIIKVVSGATLNLSGYYTKEALTAAGRLINNGTVNN